MYWQQKAAENGNIQVAQGWVQKYGLFSHIPAEKQASGGITTPPAGGERTTKNLRRGALLVDPLDR